MVIGIQLYTVCATLRQEDYAPPVQCMLIVTRMEQAATRDQRLPVE